MELKYLRNEVGCENCDQIFTQRKNLYAHIRKKHKKEPLEEKPVGKVCYKCGQHFVSKFNLHRHLKKIHDWKEASNEENERKSRILCALDKCSEHFQNYCLFREHLTKTHEIQLEYDELQFSSKSAFHKWKDEIQKHTLSSYILQATKTVLADGTKKEFYNCHRSYQYIPKGKNVRSSKRIGTNKIGQACPSRLEVSKGITGQIFVKFWKTHIGHNSDIDRVFLSKEMRAEIADMIKKGNSFDHILKCVNNRPTSRDGGKRTYPIKRKDLHNISRTVKKEINKPGMETNYEKCEFELVTDSETIIEYEYEDYDLETKEENIEVIEKCLENVEEPDNVSMGSSSIHENESYYDEYFIITQESCNVNSDTVIRKAAAIIEVCNKNVISSETCDLAAKYLDDVLNILNNKFIK